MTISLSACGLCAATSETSTYRLVDNIAIWRQLSSEKHHAVTYDSPRHSDTGFAIANMALAKDPVEGHIEAYLVSADSRGNEIIQAMAVAKLGELMEYRLTFIKSGESL